MISRERLIELLCTAFPRAVADGLVAPHDCPECSELRAQLSGLAWTEVPAEFLSGHADVLPLLSEEAYRLLLPAWLNESIRDPEGEVAQCLLVDLTSWHDVTRFTAEQRQAIIEVTRFVAANGGWGFDSQNRETLAIVEKKWWAGPAT